MTRPRILAALTSPGEPDRFVSVPRPPSGITPEIEFEGRRYRRTPRKTDGGWPVYIATERKSDA